MVQVISVVQEKGGAGKTTLLTALCSLMVEDGANVVVIDTDPQQHLESWAKKGKTALDWHFEGSDEKLIPTINHLKKNDPPYDAIFIDTAGFKSAMSIYAINAANLVLIPTKANEADAKGAVRTYSHVQSVAMSMDKKIQAYAVMMDVDANTNITHTIAEALDAQKIPRIQTPCMHRTGFKEMTSTGTAPTGSARASAKEVLAEFQRNGLLSFYKERVNG